MQPGESLPGDRARDSAHGAWLLRGCRIPGSPAWRRRALPSHAASLPGKSARRLSRSQDAATWISRFATWRGNLTALGAQRGQRSR